MALNKFEREILAELRAVTGNRKLGEKDMYEWRMGVIAPRDGERVVDLPRLGVQVAIPNP